MYMDAEKSLGKIRREERVWGVLETGAQGSERAIPHKLAGPAATRFCDSHGGLRPDLVGWGAPDG